MNIHDFIVPLHGKVEQTKMRSKITHSGVIEAIENQHIRVRIVQQAVCASCKVAAHCNASDMKEKIVDVYTESAHLTVGQQVVVSTSSAAVKDALLLGFIIPLVMMIAIIFSAKICGSSDDVSALLSIASLIPYYIGIWFFRDKIASRISFQIENNSN